MKQVNSVLKQFSLSLAKALLTLLLILSLGAGTSIIQVVGWITMIPVQFVESGSVEDAIENTFSGDHPCAMCEIAAQRRLSEVEALKSSSDPILPEKSKLEVKTSSLISPVFRKIVIISMKNDRFLLPSAQYFAAQLVISPATPPPDGFVAS